jgi:hypothetical protein
MLATRSTRSIGFAICTLALALCLSLASWLRSDESPQDNSKDAVQKSQLRREGTELRDEPGRFIPAGNRLNFVSSGGASYIGLENLNLERVGKIVADSSESVDWFITGTVSEYQGANYLFISRARRKPSLPQSRRRF